MNAAKLSMSGLALGAALFLAVNLLAGPALRGIRADLTEQKLYTLSDGTRSILDGLEEPITLRLFFSKTVAADYPRALQYAKRVQEMLEEFAAASSGQLNLEVIDPEPYSEAEELAVSYGIPGSPVQGGDMLYLGLVGTNSVDDVELLPDLSLERESSLEYDIAELVDKLERPELPVVGLISSLPLRGGQAPAPQPGMPPQQTEPWPILDVVQGRYEVRDFDPATLTEIPADLDMLLLVHPKGLTPEGLYAIDQFCMRGGKIVAFVDSYCLFDPATQGQDPMAQLNAGLHSGMDQLLSAWGVTMTQGQIVGDDSTQLGVQGRSGQQVQLPVVFDALSETMDREDILTADLTQLRFFLPAQLSKADELPSGVTVEPLVTTSDAGGLVDSMTLLGGLDPQTVADGFQADDGQLVLGYRVNGLVPSAFPDGPPVSGDAVLGDSGLDDAGGDAASTDGHIAVATAPFNGVIFSDADMLHVSVWGQRVQTLFGGVSYRATTDNASLLVNALENLSGSNALISLRSRAAYSRPFTRKQDLEADAQDRFRAEEVELEAKLSEAEAKISEMQQGKEPSNSMFLSPEQEEEIAKFRAERLETRKKLRRVKRDLRAEIDALGTKLKLMNIFALPALIALLVALTQLFRSGNRGNAKA